MHFHTPTLCIFFLFFFAKDGDKKRRVAGFLLPYLSATRQLSCFECHQTAQLLSSRSLHFHKPPLCIFVFIYKGCSSSSIEHQPPPTLCIFVDFLVKLTEKKLRTRRFCVGSNHFCLSTSLDSKLSFDASFVGCRPVKP
jgi:hypothetical protein